MKILVADDEREIADLVALYLKNEGYTVQCCYDGQSAWEIIQAWLPDLAVLDVMMPGMDGLELCQKIRSRYTFPVIMLTAKVEDMDKINGLALGADDYVTKPFNPLELIARVKAQLRRSLHYNEGQPDSRDILDFSGLVINRRTHECTLNEKPLILTPIEFDILWMLCENRGKVISSEEIFEKVWGEKYLNSNNTVMVHIRHIREKMEEPVRSPKFIKTVWGVGYKIEG